MDANLTFQQAVESSKNPDTIPTPRINRAGVRAVDEFVGANHKTPKNVSLDAYYADAENEACNMLAGYSGILEIGTINSALGWPVTLRLSPDMFDWSI